jgi:hypothetical protein
LRVGFSIRDLRPPPHDRKDGLEALRQLASFASIAANPELAEWYDSKLFP